MPRSRISNWFIAIFQRYRTAINWAGVVAFVIAGGGWYFQYQQTKEAQRLIFQMDQLSKFQDSGAKLDRSVVNLFDALAENRSFELEKQQFNDAIIEHIVAVESDRFVFGEDQTESYTEALDQLRVIIDDARGPRNSGVRVTAFARVIAARRIIMREVVDG